MIRNITKEEISHLEIEEFSGKIVTVQTLYEAEDAIAYLSKFSILGFDTETRPAYKKGQVHAVALIQLSTEDTCFLFRLNITGFPKSLISLLSDSTVRKVGLSLKDDFMSMGRRTKFIPKGFEDLQSIAPRYNISDISLQKIYALLFNKKISKKQRLTNWESEILTEAQQKYAALDAWACLRIYNKLRSK